MKQACIRCVAQLYIDELQWKDEYGVNIKLQGPPVFLRACVLGQLQHSPLHKPHFPISIDQQLTFDRVLTNCHNPSLFKEVIRGEHVKLELIQVTPDYKSGKILAKFDCSSHKFLFPSEPPGYDDLRMLTFNRSRKYRNPPRLHYSTSTTLLEATINSPIHILFPEAATSDDDTSTPLSGSKVELPGSLSSQGKSKASRQLFQSKVQDEYGAEETSFSLNPKCHHICGRDCSPMSDVHSGIKSLDQSLSTQDRLHSLLSKYTSPMRRAKVERSPPPLQPPQSTSPYYVSISKRTGPHDWPECPRRSPEPLKAASVPNSPMFGQYRRRSGTPQRAATRTPSPQRAARTPSPQRAARTPSPQRAMRTPQRTPSPCHSSPCRKCVSIPNKIPLHVLTAAPRLERMDPALVPRNYICSLDDLHDPCDKRDQHPLRPPFVIRHVDDSLMGKRNFCGAPFPPIRKKRRKKKKKEFCFEVVPETRSPVCTPEPDYGYSPQSQSPCQICKNRGYGQSQSPCQICKNRGHGQSQSPCQICKYRGHGQSQSPCQICKNRGHGISFKDIEERIERLKRECCECLHLADYEDLGDDDLSEDLERLQASLQGERDEVTKKCSLLMPEQNVTVKVGPRDFWSQRMSEFTGRKHRVLFDENLEKIYNRLYTDASMAT